MFNMEFNFQNIAKQEQARLPIHISYHARIKQECQVFSLNKQEPSKITVARKGLKIQGICHQVYGTWCLSSGI